MELFRTNDFYIFVNSEYSLWWDRHTGAFIPKTGWDLTDADDPVCLGICDGIIGTVEHCPLFDTRLLLIKESLPVGKLHGNNTVFKIKTVVFLPLSTENVDINLLPCPKHKTIEPKQNLLFDIQKNSAFTKTWGTLKNAGNTLKYTTQQAAALATSGIQKNFKEKERFEKQIIDEFYKIFNDTNSFYYSRTTDITNSLQRLCNLEKQSNNSGSTWKNVDKRFFWNDYMLKDFIQPENPLFDPWILPIIQGYIQIEDCKVQMDRDLVETKENRYDTFTLCIISRRSKYRAGTRYKRRGVDDDGEVANYVETEQIISYQTHEVSFVQVRGSVPIYWSQLGYKYRPPPRIDKGEAETRIAFEKHFTKEIHAYGPICVVNLIDQIGKEKVIFDAYSNHVFNYNSPFVTYATFDFHEYCRGMHFENVSILINALGDILRDMNYCWRDSQGHICSQNGVFRVNCIDCLDRTNVVQTAIGKAVMEIQFCKLGLISPEGVIPNSIKNTFQLLWANNGDTISKQYAGTNALKGDYTRTGERKFTGIMKDGMNSANRYYKNHFKDTVRQYCLDLMRGVELKEVEIQDFWFNLRKIGGIANEILPNETPSVAPHLALQPEFELANALYHIFRYYLSRFKDTTRQATIDLMLGNYVPEDIFNETKASQYEEDNFITAEHVKLLIEDCKKMLINQPEEVVGAWGLINADPFTGDPNETEMDSILILTRDYYFVADYDDQVDKVTNYQKVMLRDVVLLEFGMAESNVSLFKSSKHRYCIRINYKVQGGSGYYHMFRSTSFRFFNNMAVVIKNLEEEIESLKSICEGFLVAMEICGLPLIPFVQGQALDRRKSKVISSGRSYTNIYLDITLPQMTRNVSESQLLSLKNVGSKAISNVTEQFSKLNKIGNSFKTSKFKPKPKFVVGQKPKNETSSDSDEEYETSIFQPDIQTGILPHAVDSSTNRSIEQGLEMTEDIIDLPQKVDTFLPSVGIVMGKKTDPANLLEQRRNLLSRADSSHMDDIQLSSIMQSVSISSGLNPTPEIRINSENTSDYCNKNSNLDKKLSKSSLEFNDIKDKVEYKQIDRSTSDYDVQLNITQSQSESALKKLNVTSLETTKDLVLSPLSKLAKGVQNIGANFDPRKFSGQVRHVSEKEMEEHKKLQQRWQNSKTRLIAL